MVVLLLLCCVVCMGGVVDGANKTGYKDLSTMRLALSMPIDVDQCIQTTGSRTTISFHNEYASLRLNLHSGDPAHVAPAFAA